MSEETPARPRRRGLKLLLWLLVLACVVAGGFYLADSLGLLEATEDEGTAATAPTPAPAPAPTPAPEPEPQPGSTEDTATELPDLGCTIQIAEGWERGDSVPAAGIFPVLGGPDEAATDVPRAEPPLVLEEPAAGRLPLFLFGRLPAPTIGARDPKTFVTTLTARIKEALSGLEPAPEIAADRPLASLPKLFVSARELVAQGAFRDMGVDQGTGRFVAGVDVDGAVYLCIAFTPDEATRAEVDSMIASLAPVVEPQVEAEPTGGAETAEPAEPAAEAESALTDTEPAEGDG